MRITINGRFLTQPLTGMQRFAEETVRALDSLLDTADYARLRGGIEVLVPRGERRNLVLRHIAVRSRGLLRGYAWEQVELPVFARGSVLLSLCAVGPLLFRRQFVVVHDATFLAVPESFAWPARLTYRTIIPRLSRRANGVAAVSEFTRNEIARWFGLDHRCVIVCSEGSDHITRAVADHSVADRTRLRGRRFMLIVGLGGKNKNLGAAVRAFEEAKLGDVLLVIPGRRNPRVHGSGGEQDTIFTRYIGVVSDSELKALYETAIALIYPSSYEGFGLPPLEAMACGCPVISSDQAALVEVAGGCALHYPISDPGRLTESIRRIAVDESLRTDLIRRGRVRAREFRWQKTAHVLLDECLAIA